MRDKTNCGIDFPYSFEKRLAELSPGVEHTPDFDLSLDVFLLEMSVRYGPHKIDKASFKKNLLDSGFTDLVNKTKSQSGYSLSFFFYLEDFWLNIEEKNKQYEKMLLSDFLKLDNHLLFPMKLIRPGEIYLDDVTSKRYISCLYVLDYTKKIIVSPFYEKEVAKVWFNRIKHSTLASFNNVYAAGVMYFCPETKALLFANNASGHYRLKDCHTTKNIKEPLEALGIDCTNAVYSGYDDVEFKSPYRL